MRYEILHHINNQRDAIFSPDCKNLIIILILLNDTYMKVISSDAT